MPTPATPYEWDSSGSQSEISDWDAIENAIQAQIVTASGLDPAKVIWDAQSRGRPTSDFIDLNIIAIETFDPTTPEQTVSYDAMAPTGQEIILATLEDVEMRLQVQFYSAQPSAKISAHARIAAVRVYLGREDVTDALWENGVAFTESGAIQRVPKVLEDEYESRAFFEARFRFKLSTEDLTTFIEHVNAQGTLDDTKLPVNFSVEIA